MPDRARPDHVPAPVRMRELSGEQQTEREWDPDVSAGDAPQARAAWLRYIFAALCISGLGLVVAASVGLTTKAQTTESGLTALPETSSAVVVAPEKKQPTTKTGALAVFARPVSATDRPARSADLEVAIVKEQAAQRDELLARTADEVSRAAEAASGDARQKDLTDANRASREAGARIAAENLRRAIAARVAAANRRQTVESGPDDHEVASGSDRGNTESSSGGSTGGSGSGGAGGGSGDSTGGIAPVPGAVIGSHFGEYGSWSRYHTGIDFRAGAWHTDSRRAVRGRALRRQLR